MSAVPAIKFIITLPFSGMILVIFWGVLKYLTPLVDDSMTKTFLLGLWLIGIPISIVVASGIRALMLYLKSEYRMG